ncbi:methyltransferase [Alteromonas sp. ASW11-36]|uniref:Methyltransferase n=1 Tax=Alteromonas arenosi TaxID=3055817 RepID=A0ABT7SXQ0_9ALTE|nr:methyltransferase [Alteromonas sp. ASW11-36]MDM7860968.1 methyltransferase [Alteromonas sp. ASW11-36]
MSISTEPLALSLAIFYSFVAFYYAVFIGRHQRKYGECSAVHMGTKFSLHWWNHLTFRVFRIIIWSVCVLRLFVPSVDNYLGLFTWTAPGVAWVGFAMLSLGFALAIATHHQMLEHWRSGIDSDYRGELVTQGLFAFTRNPAFIGVAIAQIGFFLALPSVFSFICMLVGLTALRIQTYLEENHLNLKFGNEYTLYCQSVPRWL